MKIIRTCLILAAMLLVPAASYAVVDIGAYGSYSFKKIDDLYKTTPNPKGFGYGAIAHFNVKFVKVLQFGIGAFYERAYKSFYLWGINLPGFEKHYFRDTIGADAHLQVNVAFLSPYARISTAVWDNASGVREIKGTDYFDRYSFGGGLGFKLFWKVQLYIEYLYTVGIDKSKDANAHAAHLGLRLNL